VYARTRNAGAIGHKVTERPRYRGANPHATCPPDQIVWNLGPVEDLERSLAQEMSIEASVHGERLREFPRAVGEMVETATPLGRYVCSLADLGTPQEYGPDLTGSSTDHVQAPVDTVAPIDVRAAGRAEHETVPSCDTGASGGVRRRIIGTEVRLRLHDRADNELAFDGGTEALPQERPRERIHAQREPLLGQDVRTQGRTASVSGP